MAAVPNPPLVQVDEYLSATYRPDKEYVDGVLVERGMPTRKLSWFQALLAEHFRRYRRELRCGVYTEPRTQIIERARYRIPDLLLAPLPAGTDRVITEVPWVVVEIQSPDDRAPEQWRRFRDYLSIGVRYVVLLDPEEETAFRCQPGTLVETRFTDLELPTGRLPFDSAGLFAQLRDEMSEAG